MTEHPITPPPELVQQWAMMFEHFSDAEVFTQVVRWGANQELGACCEWLDNQIGASDPKDLWAERRPKPSSLKTKALIKLELVEQLWNTFNSHPVSHRFKESVEEVKQSLDTIRRALEALDD